MNNESNLVVCIDDTWTYNGLLPYTGWIKPVKGNIYTIRDHFHDMIGFMYYRFEEIRNPQCPNGHEPGYSVDGFRPVKRTRIDVFEQLLTPTPKPKVKVDEHALSHLEHCINMHMLYYRSRD